MAHGSKTLGSLCSTQLYLYYSELYYTQDLTPKRGYTTQDTSTHGEAIWRSLIDKWQERFTMQTAKASDKSEEVNACLSYSWCSCMIQHREKSFLWPNHLMKKRCNTNQTSSKAMPFGFGTSHKWKPPLPCCRPVVFKGWPAVGIVGFPATRSAPRLTKTITSKGDIICDIWVSSL